MWYIAAIIMTEPEKGSGKRYLCESCNVLLEAPSAQLAYEKAAAWGQDAASDHMYGLTFLGIEVLHQIGEEIGDGVDIIGSFFEKMNVWQRKDAIIPAREELAAIRLEASMDKKLGDVMEPYQQRLLTRGLKASSEGDDPAE